jgi:hypothetical protein
MTRHYCCYFDHRYVPKALAMIRSLRTFDAQALVWVLCLDGQCHRIMTAIAEPGVRLISIEEFEAGDEELATAKRNRSLIEYYFTCTPSLIGFVLRRVEHDELVTYVDGDLYFYADPACLYDELGSGSVSLIPHRFPDALREREVYGLYNVGWLSFRNDARGVAVANWWRERCNEWCYDRLEGECFADQKYLDQVPKLFDGVVVIAHDGANVAPWNLQRYRIFSRLGQLYVTDEARLIFFHFHGLKLAQSMCWLLGLRQYGTYATQPVRRNLYRPYVNRIMEIARQLERSGYVQRESLQRGPALTADAAGVWAPIRRMLGSVRALALQDALVVLAHRAF